MGRLPPPRRPGQSDDPDDAPPKERIVPIRWGRIITGLAMIVVAIVWLILDNHFGIVDTTRTATPTAIMSKAVPALGTPQALHSVQVNVKVEGKTTSAGGKQAPAHAHYLLVAVQVSNHDTSPISLRAGDFHLRSDDHVIAAGAAYPGHEGGLFTKPVPPGATATGVLVFQVDDQQTPNLIAYAPGFAAPTTALWRLS
jgi:hypothetical protein